MQLHDIAKLLGLQGVRILSNHYIRANDRDIEEVQIHLEPLTPKPDQQHLLFFATHHQNKVK